MIYGRMHPFRDSKFTLDGYGAYGRSRFKGDSYMMGSAANGRADTDTFSGGLYGTWTERFALGKAFVTPYTGIEFMTSELKGFSESGPYGRTFGHARAQNWTIPVGITIARAYQTDGGTTITPALTVAVAQDVSRMNPKSNVAGPLGTWNARGVNVSRTAFRLNAGIDVLFSNQWGSTRLLPVRDPQQADRPRYQRRPQLYVLSRRALQRMLLLGYGRPFPDPRGKGFSVCFRVRSF